MQLSETDGKMVTNLVEVAIKSGAVRDEGAFLQLLDLKQRILKAFTPEAKTPQMELVKSDA